MSSAPTFPSPSQRPQTWAWKIPNFSASQSFVSTPGVNKVASTESSRPSPSPVPSAAGSHVQHKAPATSSFVSDAEERTNRRRLLNDEEEGIKRRIASSIALSLEADRIQVLYPDIDTPFEDEIDALNRLLPYHILQQPKEDLDAITNLKGKARAVEELQDTKFALDCHKRLSALQKRFRRARIAAGKHPSPSPQSIYLERLVRDSDRQETSNLEQAASATRAELDKLRKAQILATMKPNKPPIPASVSYATSSSTPSYSNHTFSVAPTPTYSQFYNSYTYAYGQNGSTSYTPGASIPTFSVQQAPPSSISATKPQFSVPIRPPAPSIGPQPTSAAIPLQVPVAFLPALQAIGILPVPKASLPPPSDPQPAAVLVGTTNNGAMLSLEINASLLQGPQMSGLAVLLSDLVKSSGNANSSTPGKQAASETPASNTKYNT